MHLIFIFIWGGRCEYVARARMVSGVEEGGRDVTTSQQGLARSPVCPWAACSAEETTRHIMWDCSFVQVVQGKLKTWLGQVVPLFKLKV